MATSAQITEACNATADPAAAEIAMLKQTRYMVAQKPAADDCHDTFPGYYNGKFVIPGPLSNPKISDVLTTYDMITLKDDYSIRFTDNLTTDNAEQSVRAALYTLMSNAEADDYEQKLVAWYKNNPGGKPKVGKSRVKPVVPDIATGQVILSEDEAVSAAFSGNGKRSSVLDLQKAETEIARKEVALEKRKAALAAEEARAAKEELVKLKQQSNKNK